METEFRSLVAHGTGKGMLPFGMLQRLNARGPPPRKAMALASPICSDMRIALPARLHRSEQATDRGPMGPSINEVHLIINPWQTAR